MQKWNKRHLVGNTVQNHNHLAEIKWLCQHIMWWWFLTSGNTVQEENFHRILMKLLMRQMELQNWLLKDKPGWGYRLGYSISSFLLPVQYWLCCSVLLLWSLCSSTGASLGPGYTSACDSSRLMSRAQKALWPQPKKYPACACSWLWKAALKVPQSVQ